jgi:hypothetical protein
MGWREAIVILCTTQGDAAQGPTLSPHGHAVTSIVQERGAKTDDAPNSYETCTQTRGPSPGRIKIVPACELRNSSRCPVVTAPAPRAKVGAWMATGLREELQTWAAGTRRLAPRPGAGCIVHAVAHTSSAAFTTWAWRLGQRVTCRRTPGSLDGGQLPEATAIRVDGRDSHAARGESRSVNGRVALSSAAPSGWVARPKLGVRTPVARSMLPLPFPKEAVRDLLGITRVLRRAEATRCRWTNLASRRSEKSGRP